MMLHLYRECRTILPRQQPVRRFAVGDCPTAEIGASPAQNGGLPDSRGRIQNTDCVCADPEIEVRR
jgi:hypothetical protein